MTTQLRGFAQYGVSRFEDRDLGARRVRVQVGKPLAEQREIGHNRWHYDIAPLAELEPGQDIILESIGYDDYQLKDTDDMNDVRTMDLSRVHPLTGPVYVKGAQPGDLLVVDLLEVSPLSGVGYSCVIPGIGGIVKEMFPEGFKSVWYMRGDTYAESRHIPGVRVPAIPHPGVIGVAPSREMLQMWNERERPLVEEGTGKAYGPEPSTAILRTDTTQSKLAEAARTVPPRENGGNVDIKDLGPGARVYFPVFVEGALLSVGDLHFAEGDGEVTWNAIEMDGITWLRVGLIKEGARKYNVTTPMFMPGPVRPSPSNPGNRFLVFTGFPFRDREQAYNDATMAARECVLKAIDYLGKFGFSPGQAYTILSVAPIELRISGIVDVPNACVTLHLPLDIFDKDILPR